MTFKNNIQECYVYITLPGDIQATTAGRFILTNNPHGVSVGQFVYGKKYLQNPSAVAIDPVELKLSEQVFENTRLQGIFSALRDAGPDFWGRKLIERHLESINLTEIDYLLNSPDDRAGALGFGLNKTPPAPKRKFNRKLDLAMLQDTADLLITEELEQKLQTSDVLQVEKLLLIGTSMGGARPKTLVEDKEGLWLAKFNRLDDKWNNARVEHSMLNLAKMCGMNVATSKVVSVGDRDVLLVKRFDRERVKKNYLRSRMVSAFTLLQVEEYDQTRRGWSYILLNEKLRKISLEAKKDSQELFRRMCFNALISNIDDHPRNHAFIANQSGWRLSPAYDLVPAMPISIEQRDLAMICGDYGRSAKAKNLLSQSDRFLLEQSEAQKILEQMENCVKQNWYNIARKNAVSEQDCEKISSAFVYPGFRA